MIIVVATLQQHQEYHLHHRRNHHLELKILKATVEPVPLLHAHILVESGELMKRLVEPDDDGDECIEGEESARLEMVDCSQTQIPGQNAADDTERRAESDEVTEEEADDELESVGMEAEVDTEQESAECS